MFHDGEIDAHAIPTCAFPLFWPQPSPCVSVDGGNMIAQGKKKYSLREKNSRRKGREQTLAPCAEQLPPDSMNNNFYAANNFYGHIARV